MREMSLWTVAASLFFSVSLFTSAAEAVSSFSLAGAGNPAAVEQGLSGLVSRMASTSAALPKVMADAGGKAVATNASFSTAARFTKQKNFALKQGNAGALPTDISQVLGLTDGSKGYGTMTAAWTDDDDKSLHLFNVGTDNLSAIVITYKQTENATWSINWRTDVNGKLISTSYSQAGSRTISVPNSKYSAEFDAQAKYWDELGSQMPGTTVASN